MKKIAALILALLLCLPAAAFADTDKGPSEYRYQNTIYRSYDDGEEMLFIAQGYHGVTQDQLRQQLFDAVTPNRTERATSVASTGIERLTVQAELCAIVVEPVAGTHVTVDYIGVADKASLPVTTSVEAGTLSISVMGTTGEDRLVRTVPGAYANVVRVGVPKDLLHAIAIENGRWGLTTVRDLDIPITGDAGSGCIRIEGSIREAATQLTGTRGDIIVTGGILRGDITASVTSGDVRIDGGIVDGALRLTATSGELRLDAGIAKDAVLTVKSGDIKVVSGLVKTGVFTATTGDVHLEIGEVGERVDAGVTSGDLRIALTSKPTDLHYRQTVTSKFAEVTVPAGWKDGYRIGEGSAALNVSVGNGDYKLTIKT